MPNQRRNTLKTKLIASILLLVIIALLLAGDELTEQEEYFRKKQELDLLAKRFKDETGFEGEITYNFDRVKLTQFFGNFPDIEVVAWKDSSHIRQIFDEVYIKIKPYLTAKENQLKRMSIEVSPISANTVYKQIINGYNITTGGNTVSITYLPNKDSFTITDSSSDVSSEIIPILVSKDEAKTKLIDAYQRSAFYNTDMTRHMKGPEIGYAKFLINGEISEYRLYWYMTFWNHAFYIDVERSEIINKPIQSFHNNNSITIE